MKHTLTVTIDTPKPVMHELQFLVRTSDRLAEQARTDLYEAVDLSQVLAAHELKAEADRLRLRARSYAGGAGMALGMERADCLGLLNAAREAG